jgi:hypothetical protein
MLLAVTGAANACSSLEGPPTEEQLFAKASAVFLAHVVRTEETQGANPLLVSHPTSAMVDATFRVIEVLKGEPPADGKVRSLVYGAGNCSVALLAGLDYLVFLQDGNFVLWPGGTMAFFNLDGTEPKRLLEKFRNLAKQAP